MRTTGRRAVLLGVGLGVGVALLGGCGRGGTAPAVDTTPSATGTVTAAASTPSEAASAPGATPSGSSSGRASGNNVVDEGYRGRFRAVATVLEGGGHGPQLCLGAIAASLPPQCGGPDLVGWSWTGLPDVARQSGVTWGVFVVVGRYDGRRFTLTEPPKAPDPNAVGGGRPPEQDLTTPCPAPAGGWVPPDPARATEATFDSAMQLASTQPGYAISWIDQNLPPGVELTDTTASPDPRAIPNDPRRIVLNVKVTGDPAPVAKVLRAVWGGNLCVTKGPRTDADLRKVQDALLTTPGLLEVSPDGFAGRVNLTVVRATTQQQAALDATFGPGVVALRGALVPIDL